MESKGRCELLACQNLFRATGIFRAWQLAKEIQNPSLKPIWISQKLALSKLMHVETLKMMLEKIHTINNNFFCVGQGIGRQSYKPMLGYSIRWSLIQLEQR